MFKRSDDLIFEFAQTILEENPGLTPDDIYAICRSPFKAVTTQMKSGGLKDVRIKYLGNFMVFPGRVKGVLTNVQKGFNKQKVSPELMQKIQAIHDNYFKLREDGEDTCKEISEG